MSTRTAIKAATLAAQKQMEVLDAAGIKALTDIYAQAAAEIKARILAAAQGPGGIVQLPHLRALLGQVERILGDLAGMWSSVLDTGLEEAAGLGTRPFAMVATANARMEVSRQAVSFVRAFVASDGLQLSDRVWRVDRGARDQVVNAIERGVVMGHGAGQASSELLGGASASALADKAESASGERLGTQAEELLTGAGNARDNAMRVFRTEINRAHGEAYMDQAAKTRGFAGFRFLLSPAHPKTDICDLLASQNVYGLGAGVYPSREKCPWPAHPNTLSFVEMVFEDEISDADRAGKETPLEALDRFPEDQQAEILGKGKAAIHGAGQLTQGMIRAPLGAVRRRLEKRRK